MSMINRAVGVNRTDKELNRIAAFATGSPAYLPAFDLFLGGGDAAWPCATGAFIAPIASTVQGGSGFNGMIMESMVGALKPQNSVRTTVQAKKRHAETLAPYPWRPPA
ncbi:hypothetical protein [Actinocorallia longicatena]|uniref:hypothetical protein n=1 Tax=Actinocorallia longicatena TaxID=111803 RepID=UPI0031D467C9